MNGSFRKMLSAKIHRATVTGADVNYEGSITIPPELLAAAGIHPSVVRRSVLVPPRIRAEPVAVPVAEGCVAPEFSGLIHCVADPGEQLAAF